MTWFSKATNWIGEKVKSVAPALPAILGVAGFAAGLVAPGVGAAIGKFADNIGNKISDITGIGDGKPGILGIGDGLPGVFGIGTGKNKEQLIDEAVKRMKELLAKSDLTPAEKSELEDVKKTASNSTEGKEIAEKAAKETANKDMKSEGINPLYLVGGGLLAFFALGGSGRR